MRRLFLLALGLVAITALAGGMVGNGGDSVLQEFNLRGLQLSAYFHAHPDSFAKIGLNPDRFLEVVRSTKLEGVDHLYLNGQEVDAINYPAEKRIQVSHTRWEESAKRGDAYIVELRIALHEFLWVSGFDDSNYVYSNPLIVEMEKSVGPITDPDVQVVILRKFCSSLSMLDFDHAKGSLIWGLDINSTCPGQKSTPLDWMMMIRSRADRQTWLGMIQAMLEVGLNPNSRDFSGSPVISTLDIEFAKLLFKFGADPNLDWDNGQTAFGFASGGLSLEGVKLFMENGADPNLHDKYASPARNLVSRENNADTVEYLIQTGKVDWCAILDSNWNQPRTIDSVRSEYKTLLRKYAVTCPRLKVSIGNGPTCEDSKAKAVAACTAEGYKVFAFKPWSNAEDCLNSDGSREIYVSRYFCTDN